MRLDGRTEYINLCDCLEGYVKVNDACQPGMKTIELQIIFYTTFDQLLHYACPQKRLN